MPRSPILDPRAVPVIGTDAELPAVPASSLTETALRRRFAHPPVWQPETAGDAGALVSGDAISASVLVPLVLRDSGPTVLLTRRTEHLRDHAGQVSFPGGRVEDDDADAVATALREAREEVGLELDRVEVIGALPVYTTVTSFVVTPVVAFIRPGYSLQLDPAEVAETFEAPLAFLMDPAHHRRHRFEFGGEARQFLSMPWTDATARGGPREFFIWGATAAMLRNLYRFLAA